MLAHSAAPSSRIEPDVSMIKTRSIGGQLNVGEQLTQPVMGGNVHTLETQTSFVHASPSSQSESRAHTPVDVGELKRTAPDDEEIGIGAVPVVVRASCAKTTPHKSPVATMAASVLRFLLFITATTPLRRSLPRFGSRRRAESGAIQER